MACRCTRVVGRHRPKFKFESAVYSQVNIIIIIIIIIIISSSSSSSSEAATAAVAAAFTRRPPPRKEAQAAAASAAGGDHLWEAVAACGRAASEGGRRPPPSAGGDRRRRTCVRRFRRAVAARPTLVCAAQLLYHGFLGSPRGRELGARSAAGSLPRGNAHRRRAVCAVLRYCWFLQTNAAKKNPKRRCQSVR